MRAALLLLLFIFGVSLPATAESRVALVIGNSDYAPEIGRLPNAINDADLMVETLNRLDFKVTKLLDADRASMRRAITDFGSALINAGVDATGLIFYAGHGVQVGSTDYLIPVGSQIRKAWDLPVEAIEADWLATQMEFAGNRTNIVILDASRNYRLEKSKQDPDRFSLARTDAAKGIFIAYSAAPGQDALDGTGRNSPFTAVLAKEMLKPGLALDEIFRKVRMKVMVDTNNRQVPWVTSTLTGTFYFVPPSPGGTIAQPAAPSVPTPGIEAPTAPVIAAASLPAKEIKAGQAAKDCADCPEMIAVPPGKFSMGSPQSEVGRSAGEGPQAKIAIDAFAIGKYPITRGEFAAFVKDSYHRPAERCYVEVSTGKFDFRDGADWRSPGYAQTDDDPVVCISWIDAEQYVKWLTEKTGKQYRLPSEAELEYAIRAGSTTSRYWGDAGDKFCAYGNTADRTAHEKYSSWQVANCDDGKVHTSPVGSYKPNAFGLYDMLGNVKVWAADCWNETLEKLDRHGAPMSSGKCGLRAVRGSSWDDSPSNARAAFREGSYATNAFFNTGFRVARGL